MCDRISVADCLSTPNSTAPSNAPRRTTLNGCVGLASHQNMTRNTRVSAASEAAMPTTTRLAEPSQESPNPSQWATVVVAPLATPDTTVERTIARPMRISAIRSYSFPRKKFTGGLRFIQTSPSAVRSVSTAPRPE